MRAKARKSAQSFPLPDEDDSDVSTTLEKESGGNYFPCLVLFTL